jgi:hypothetical protein
MKKQFTELIGVFCTLVFFSLLTTSTVQAQYCPSTSTSTGFEHITEVSYDTYTNTSGLENYADNTGDGSIGNISPGIASSIDVQVTNAWPGDNIWVFIDADGDGDFSSADLVGQIGSITTEFGSAAPVDVTIPITVPVGSVPGITRLRVKLQDGTNADPCEASFTFGEVEDYLINVVGGECLPPSISTTINDNCENETYNVSLTINSLGETDDQPNIGLIFAYTLSTDPDADEIVINLPPVPGLTLPELFPAPIPFGVEVNGEIRASNALG